jgi:hypothetical protein
MTTNVYDNKAGLLASDSRISSAQDGFVFFVDNCGYEKIVFDEYLAVLFAGDIDLVDPWKVWFLAGREHDEPPVGDDLSICVVDIENGEIVSDRGGNVSSPCNMARFAGTGAWHAKRCWTQNEKPLLCVETAYEKDKRSGGKVKFLNRSSQENNVEHKITVDKIIDVMASQGGVIMPNVAIRDFLPIEDLIKTDAAVNDAFAKVRSGGAASLCAPFIGMGTPWTQEEKDQLYTGLRKYPPSKRK